MFFDFLSQAVSESLAVQADAGRSENVSTKQIPNM
jgi:hypothetical protein